MKKIALTFEGNHFPEETLQLVRKLNDISPVWLTAVFVPEVDYSALWSMDGGLAGAVFVPEVQDEDEIIATNGAKLEEFCRRHAIKVSIHKERLDFAIPLIQKEARFSDLMVLSSQHFFDNIDNRQPNTYMKEVLHKAECPVLLLPETFYLPENIILAYDGTPSSVYAIKQFAYLFPEFSGRPTTLVYLCGAQETQLPDQHEIQELASSHFTNLHMTKLEIDAREFFSDWISRYGKAWLVAGAYGRSEISQLFGKSFISGLIRDHRVPVFVAH
ncbi:hypothetical protein Q4E93_02730 [Flavitalea sp. BT771]|uniref:hypothetical protein n=1 Tax=Flavitalea sp. BT771 TaxID=3063329 RepID=UPI0026E302AC|nr:hypothetical protein [Flavitalea sp. BT771]MDO6429487.1 hypothetical protein [Flavitalea sp. BT771]MDV6218385.1 hypothetical protein [Flavitalea sp. BT771]